MRRFYAFSAVALFLAARAASAQDIEFAKREARARFAEGLQLHDAGRDEDARAKFLQAYAVLKHPDVLFNLARAEQLSGHEVEAIRHYKAYVRDRDPKITEADRASARQHIGELAGRVGSITIVASDGAAVTVDGVLLDHVAPVADAVDVAAGRHVVVARRGTAVKTVECVAALGQSVRVEVIVEEPAVVVVPPPVVPPPVTTPPVGHEEPAGTSGFWTARNTTAVVIGGVAVVAAGAGISFAEMSSSQSDTAKGLRTTIGGAGCNGAAGASANCQSLASATSSQHTDAVASTVFYVGAAAVAVAGVVTWALWPKERRAPAASMLVPTPVVGPQGGGVQWVGSF